MKYYVLARNYRCSLCYDRVTHDVPLIFAISDCLNQEYKWNNNI